MFELKARLRRALTAAHLQGLYRVWRWLARQDPRRWRRQARFRRWNRGAAPDEMVIRPGLRLRIDPRSREPFEWFCFRSEEMVRELDTFAIQMAARRRFLDVGACHGIFSLAFAHRRPEASAVAVEPSAIAYSVLERNIRLGGLDNVVARQIACGPGDGTLRMRPSWHHLEALAAEQAAPDAVAVPMQSVDGLCSELGFRPDLVKIDVEGYELAVLAGARATLGSLRPPLLLEIHPQRLRQLGGSPVEVVALLERLGYGFSRLTGGPLGGASGTPLSGRQVAGRESVSRVLCTARP
jgi:FkbM family methyltransferase